MTTDTILDSHPLMKRALYNKLTGTYYGRVVVGLAAQHVRCGKYRIIFRDGWAYVYEYTSGKRVFDCNQVFAVYHMSPEKKR